LNNNNNRNNRRRGRGNRNQGGNGSQLNRIDSRARGNAPQMLDKYKKLAQDAHHNGDRVQMEYYLQFADHYFRVIADNKARLDEQRGGRRPDDRDQADEDYGGDDLDFDRGRRSEQASRSRYEPQDMGSRADFDEGETGQEGESFLSDNRDDGRDDGRGDDRSERQPNTRRLPRKPREVNRAERPMLRVEVMPDGARAHITAAGVSVDGRGRALDDVIDLVDGTRIDTGHGVHLFRALDGEYAGVVLADSNMRLAVSGGQVAEVGREPAHPGLMFIDRRGNANIRWCSGPRAAKAKAGGFTMDRALAGRRQASVALEHGELVVTPLHERCTTWRMARDQGPLHRVADRTVVEPGDHLVVGTWVVGVRTSETQ
jgi:hypothetical protein